MDPGTKAGKPCPALVAGSTIKHKSWNKKKLEKQPHQYPCLSLPILQLIKQIAGVNAIERIRARDGKRQVQDAPLSEIAFTQAFVTNK
jgi:hypothetical protein